MTILLCCAGFFLGACGKSGPPTKERIAAACRDYIVVKDAVEAVPPAGIVDRQTGARRILVAREKLEKTLDDVGDADGQRADELSNLLKKSDGHLRDGIKGIDADDPIRGVAAFGDAYTTLDDETDAAAALGYAHCSGYFPGP